MVMSGSSVTTARAAVFMRSKALLSLGFSNPYFAHSLHEARLDISQQNYNGDKLILCEAPPVYADDDPSVREEVVWLFERPHVFKPALSRLAKIMDLILIYLGTYFELAILRSEARSRTDLPWLKLSKRCW